MSAVDFEVLKLIPKMLEEMQCLKQEVTELKQHIKPLIAPLHTNLLFWCTKI